MNQAEVMEAINNDDRTAEGLLLDVMPTAVTRFNRVTTSLNALLIDIRKYFPDACYYSASDTLCLMLGDSHNDDDQPQRELVVTATNKPMIGGGDW
ncbi:hypothetical protein DN356_13045 [Salmonella enterica subsp. enterica serovar Chester]|nr:hypothetical protein [Salmonella enterica subsp. enterica serovar Chester]EBV2647527.1 hypothetical protein [Salmonella enterica subsp. enterica serovar Chester]EBW4606344.1 hypothetical protein [Salmonella enterica subsp. enterica serovar Chester]ECF0097551.1 hypothetical protein [Salmonella enterica subsp. enterica serovar Chester]HCL0948589.1 hypothetical protein [Salmonella enterica subsp. enterica serovar Muenchen]